MPGVRRGQEGRCGHLRSWKGPSCAGSGGSCPLWSGPLLRPTLAGAVPKPERVNTEDSVQAMGQRRAGKGTWRGRGRVRMQRAGLRSSLPRALGSQRSGASGPPRTGQRVPKAPQREQQLCPSSIPNCLKTSCTTSRQAPKWPRRHSQSPAHAAPGSHGHWRTTLTGS